MTSLDRLRDFVIRATLIVEKKMHEDKTVLAIKPLLEELIAKDDWLPDEFAQPHPIYYRQYLLHADPLERFSVVSFVWGPGQKTPIHDHRVWGLVGVLRGAELSTDYFKEQGGRLVAHREERLEQGAIITLSPNGCDIHTIRNAFENRVSVSIHVYGANIGAVRRAVFEPVTGVEKPFVSGYSNIAIPNLWDRSESLRNEAMVREPGIQRGPG
jgi:predicted metal-dependent enzyme (double-stranded beta helix superfamily)